MARGRTRCYRIKVNGGWGLIRGQLGDPCPCGCVAVALCDYPVGNGKTCDRKICKDTPCGRQVAPDVDYCLHHFAEWEKFRDSGGVKQVLENVTPFERRE